MEEINLVDTNGNRIGGKEKIAVHKDGDLHEAFSIFILNSKGEMLIQKRADDKYHSGGLWTNECCSHPKCSEDLVCACRRRLKQEIGITAKLKEIFAFRYRIKFKNGLTENELDHVFVGIKDQNPKLNPKEVSDFRWIPEQDLKKWVDESPDEFTYWFKKIYKRVFVFANTI